eukprot:2199039-Pyramimonas_sp.AAC.1
MVGVPWDRGIGQIGRPKGKKVVVVPAVPPEEKQDEPEVEDTKQDKRVTDATIEGGIADDGQSYKSAKSGSMEDVEVSTPRQEGGGSSSSQQAQPAASTATPRARKRSASEAESPEVEMGTVGGVD